MVFLLLMKGNYNSIAPYYDRLSTLIFGDSIVESQRYLINCIGAGSAILIVGGGTGWLLEEIARKHVQGLHITYVEMSEKMMELSKKRDVRYNKVVFLNEPIQQVKLDKSFDIVITPFLLDNFSDETHELIFRKLDQLLLPGGLWLYADFQITQTHAIWQKPLIKIMYLFFRWMCDIEANKLPCTIYLFHQFYYKKGSSKTFVNHFIISSCYQKKG